MSSVTRAPRVLPVDSGDSATSTTAPVRFVNAGKLAPVRSQTVYHAVARAMDETSPDTIIVARPSSAYVCIGLFQELDKEVDVAYCRTHGLPVVRREVGGGAVYLDENQVFAQWVFRRGHLPLRLEHQIQLYVGPLIDTYADFGIEAAFRPVNDVHVHGKKIGGTGAASIGRAAVVVGSFMIDFDRVTMARVLRVSSEKMRDKVVSGLEQYMTTMRDLLPDPPARREIVAHYVSHCEACLGRPLVESELSSRELDEAEVLDELLASEDWLAQRGPAGPHRVKIHEGVVVAEAEYKAPGGLIRVTGRLRDGAVDVVELSGDFAMQPASGLTAIEAGLRGCPIQWDALLQALTKVFTEQSLEVPGVGPSDIAAAMLQLRDERSS